MDANKKPSRLGRVARKLGCVLLQVVLVTGVVVTAVYAAAKGDHGEVAHELAKGTIGGALGGLLVGAILALQKAGGPA